MHQTTLLATKTNIFCGADIIHLFSIARNKKVDSRTGLNRRKAGQAVQSTMMAEFWAWTKLDLVGQRSIIVWTLSVPLAVLWKDEFTFIMRRKRRPNRSSLAQTIDSGRDQNDCGFKIDLHCDS